MNTQIFHKIKYHFKLKGHRRSHKALLAKHEVHKKSLVCCGEIF